MHSKSSSTRHDTAPSATDLHFDNFSAARTMNENAGDDEEVVVEAKHKDEEPGS